MENILTGSEGCTSHRCIVNLQIYELVLYIWTGTELLESSGDEGEGGRKSCFLAACQSDIRLY